MTEDGVHPLDDGHRLYADVIIAAVEEMEKTNKPIDHRSKLATAFVADNWQAAKMVPITESMLTGSWMKLGADHTFSKRFSNRMGEIWESKQPGSRLTFKFRGSMARLYDLLAPDGGQVTITVDGKPRPKPVPRFDVYSTYERLATLPIDEGLDPRQVHTVVVELHPEQPDRSRIASRLKDPEQELKSAKYQGTCIRVGQLMLLGDLVE